MTPHLSSNNDRTLAFTRIHLASSGGIAGRLRCSMKGDVKTKHLPQRQKMALALLRAKPLIVPALSCSSPIRSGSMPPPAPHRTGHFYFAQTGHLILPRQLRELSRQGRANLRCCLCVCCSCKTFGIVEGAASPHLQPCFLAGGGGE